MKIRCKHIKGDICSIKKKYLGLFGKVNCLLIKNKECDEFIPDKTVKEVIEYINTEYYFNRFDDNLVNELYSLLLEYKFIVKVIPIQEELYDFYIDDLQYCLDTTGLHLTKDK